MEQDVETKATVEVEHRICRCCLNNCNFMVKANVLREEFSEVAGINVNEHDDLPDCVCLYCAALLRKTARFRRQILAVNDILFQYLARCTQYPIDRREPELLKFATTQLSPTKILQINTDKPKTGFHKVLQHEKVESSYHVKIELEETAVKVEDHFDDFEDDMPLLELRTNKESSIAESVADEASKPGKKRGKGKKKKKHKEGKDENVDSEGTIDGESKKRGYKSGIRKPLELDPNKIRVITLNPEEQLRQREEETKNVVNYPYHCKLCFKGFNFESKLQNHMAKHSPSRGKYMCTVCQMHLPTVYSYSVHMLIHTRRYECVVCGRRMIDRQSIYHHYRSQHEGITTIIKCDICGKESSNEKTHRSHVRNHHSGSRPECDQCGKTFVNKDSLTDHLLIHTGEKKYSCPVCSKLCRSRSHVNTHMKMHSDVKEFYCVECDVRFKTAHNLRVHLNKSLKHKDEMTFKFGCATCGRRFESASRLTTHTRVQHLGVRPYGCSACGARLASRAGLQAHARAVHAQRRPPRAHVCHACGRAFRAKSVLVNHLRTHTGERPFPCALCPRAFTQRTALRTHHRLVHLKIKQKIPPPRSEDKMDLFPKTEPPPSFEWNRNCEVYGQTLVKTLECFD